MPKVTKAKAWLLYFIDILLITILPFAVTACVKKEWAPIWWGIGAVAYMAIIGTMLCHKDEDFNEISNL